LLAEDVLTVGSPYHPAKQRLAFGLASSGAYLLSGAVCTLIALLLSQRLDLRND